MKKQFTTYFITTFIFSNLLILGSQVNAGETYQELHCPTAKIEAKYYKADELVNFTSGSLGMPTFSQGSIDTIVFNITAADPQGLPLRFYTASYLITGQSSGEARTGWTSSNIISLDVQKALTGYAFVQIRIDNNDGNFCIGTGFDYDIFQNFYYNITPHADSILPFCSSANWSCNNWGTCSQEGLQTRGCNVVTNCQGGILAPAITQSCVTAPPVCTSWAYSNWSTCTNGQQTRAITSSQPTSCAGGNPTLSQSCNSISVCTDNNWNSTLSPTICPSNGQQVKRWTKAGQCQNGVSHPSEETVSCNYQDLICTNFAYNDWGACSASGVQSRTIFFSSPSGCIGGNPVLSQNCQIETEIKNNRSQITESNNTNIVTNIAPSTGIEKEDQNDQALNTTTTPTQTPTVSPTDAKYITGLAELKKVPAWQIWNDTLTGKLYKVEAKTVKAAQAIKNKLDATLKAVTTVKKTEEVKNTSEMIDNTLASTVTSLNVRQTPSSKAKVVLGIKKGASYVITGEQADWYQIKISNKLNGWVMKKYVKTKK